MPSTALAKADPITPERMDLVRNTIARGCTDNELELFVGVCNRTGLDPFSRQIYALKVGGKMQPLVSIDGFRVIAARSNQYEGQVGPHWCGEDGKWVDVWLKKEPPVAARVGVLRTDFREPLFATAKFASYSTGQNLWKKMPELMIAKVAEALALRRAFPNDLSGLYTADEMGQAKSKRKRKPPKKVKGTAEEPGMPMDVHRIVEIEEKTGESKTTGNPWTVIKCTTHRGEQFIVLSWESEIYIDMVRQAHKSGDAVQVHTREGKNGGEPVVDMMQPWPATQEQAAFAAQAPPAFKDDPLPQAELLPADEDRSPSMEDIPF